VYTAARNEKMSELIDNSNKKHPGGPKTPEGKHRSSLNSMRHGLTSKTIVLPAEDSTKFDELLADYIGQYAPETKLELDLVHELAALRWRLQRIWNVESTVIDVTVQRKAKQVDQEFTNPAPNLRVALAFMDLAENTRTLALLNRYETRLARRFHQVLTEIEHLQAGRKAEERRQAEAAREADAGNPAEVSQSPTDPNSYCVLLTIPKSIVRNELPPPVPINRRDEKNAASDLKNALRDEKRAPTEDEAA
jgi:hypothetical protein